MPIKPENRARYPSNWKTEIRPAILKRAQDKCERCQAPNGQTIFRFTSRGIYMLEDGEMFDAETGDFLRIGRLTDEPTGEHDDFVRIVLTIAHLDHKPENCDPSNLRALCQRCHLRYDHAHHMANARETRRSRKATGDLLG